MKNGKEEMKNQIDQRLMMLNVEFDLCVAKNV